jgi:homocysteine S-methyltransferase
MNRFRELLASGGPLVLEGAVVELLRRDPAAPPLHPTLANALHPLSVEGQRALVALWNGYLDAILPTGLPALLLTPTWRASRERGGGAGFEFDRLNGEGARLLGDLRREREGGAAPILVGGLLGCAGDAYRPEEGLGEEDSFRYHLPQATALAEAGVDFLLASTLPALPEAIGLARAMASTGLPAVVGFVFRPSGTLLDGTPVEEAIERIDGRCGRSGEAPAGYLATCTHPDTLGEALSGNGVGPRTRGRLLGIQGNGSRLSPEELDGREAVDSTEPTDFAGAMLDLRRRFGLRIFGGCCGTDERHIDALARALSPASPPAVGPVRTR